MLLRRAVLITIFAVLIGGAAEARESSPVAVLVDNSYSIRRLDLASTFRADIAGLVSVETDRRFLMATIGTAHADPRVFDSAKVSAWEVETHLRRLFSFDDERTQIAASLESFAGTTEFREVDLVLVVSDMEPSNIHLTKSWTFGLSDVDDLQDYVKILTGWAKRDKSVIIGLLGWDKVPSAVEFPAGALKGFAQRLDEKREAIRSDAKARGVPNAQGRSTDQVGNRKLVRLGLTRLKQDGGERVRLVAIPKTLNDEINHDGFRNYLCRFIEIPGDSGYCPKAGERPVTVQVSLDRTMGIRDYAVARLKDAMPQDITDAGPFRPLEPLRVNRRLTQPEHPEGAVVHVWVGRGSAAGKPYDGATLMATVRTRTETIERLDAPPSDQSINENQEQFALWLAGQVEAIVSNALRTHFQPKSVLKKILLVSAATDEPVDDNYTFRVYYTFKKGIEFDESEWERAASHSWRTIDGLIEARLPSGTRALKVVLESPRLGERELIPMASLEPRAVESPRNPTVKIPRYCFKPLAFNVEGSGAYVLELYLARDPDRRVTRRRLASNVDAVIDVLPGTYDYRLVPEDLERLEFHESGIFVETDCEQESSSPQSLEAHVTPDPFAGNGGRAAVREWLAALDKGDGTSEKERLRRATSAYVLPQLLKATSVGFAVNDVHLGAAGIDKRTFLAAWQELFDSFFLRETTVLPISLARTYEVLALEDFSENATPISYMQTLFEIMINGTSLRLAEPGLRGQEQRQEFALWLSELTGRELAGGPILGRELAMAVCSRVMDNEVCGQFI